MITFFVSIAILLVGFIFYGKLTEKMNDNGVIICETSKGEALADSVNGWTKAKEKNYGKSKLTYYRKSI